MSRSATIVTLGDYVDRGPKSRQIIERLMDWMSPDLKLVCFKGNHEDMMWHCCRHPIRAGWWMKKTEAAPPWSPIDKGRASQLTSRSFPSSTSAGWANFLRCM